MNLKNAAQAEQFWSNGDEANGYASCWKDVYSYLLMTTQKNERVRENSFFLRYEDLTRKPIDTIMKVSEFIGLEISNTKIKRLVGGIRERNQGVADVNVHVDPEMSAIKSQLGY